MEQEEFHKKTLRYEIKHIACEYYFMCEHLFSGTMFFRLTKPRQWVFLLHPILSSEFWYLPFSCAKPQKIVGNIKGALSIGKGQIYLVVYEYYVGSEYNRWSTPEREFSGDNSSFFNFFKLFQKKKIIKAILCNFSMRLLKYFLNIFLNFFCPPKHRKTPLKSCTAIPYREITG